MARALLDPDPGSFCGTTATTRARAARLCARAFRDDPLMSALLPDASRRQAALAALFGYRFASLPDRVVVLDEPDLAPAAVMVAALSTDAEPLFSLRALPQLVRLLTTVHPTTLRRLARVHDVAIGVRAALGPHVLLDVIAVDAAARGRGLAGRLIRELRRRAAAFGLPVVLETSQPANVDLYRHLGFQVVAAQRLPDLAVDHVVMRAPS
jgi:ribosomal protein S18 acetylase RimI-like enzyme